MANSDKDILITPNRGSSTDDPKIDFVGGSASGASTITAYAYDLDGGTVSFEGTEGQLFSITNNLTSGSIFSVNDISGIPSIDVDADGTIQLAPYGSNENVGIGTTNPLTKLQVGGVIGFNDTNIKIGDATVGQNITSGTYNFLSGTGAGASITSAAENILSLIHI